MFLWVESYFGYYESWHQITVYNSAIDYVMKFSSELNAILACVIKLTSQPVYKVQNFHLHTLHN
jgi:hypothetical protein